MQLVDTHCHIHFDEFGFNPEAVISSANEAGVNTMICVGCSLGDSKRAVEFAEKHINVWASVGAHPHNGVDFLSDPNSPKEIRNLAKNPKVVAIGEIGLDYFRSTVNKNDQEKTLRAQLEITADLDLPYIFHIREAWNDFWKIVDDYPGLRGVVHSFSSDPKNLDATLTRGLYVGLNGIMTFTKDKEQLEAAKLVPLDRLLLETDAPFLTPNPFRGKTCEPKHILNIAEFLAILRTEQIIELAAHTTENAKTLFKI